MQEEEEEEERKGRGLCLFATRSRGTIKSRASTPA